MRQFSLCARPLEVQLRFSLGRLRGVLHGRTRASAVNQARVRTLRHTGRGLGTTLGTHTPLGTHPLRHTKEMWSRGILLVAHELFKIT